MMLGVDHTKFGRNAMVNLGDISQIDMLFTDQTPPEELGKRLAEHETHIEIIK